MNIEKAVIPVAGLGSRLMPATLAIPKPLLPVMDHRGRIIPILLALITEALEAGIREIALVVSPATHDTFQHFFSLPQIKPTLDTLKDQRIQDDLMALWRKMAGHIHLISQPSPEGFGHAVYQAAGWVADSPFLLLLGDHLYRSRTDISCCRQIMNAFRITGTTRAASSPAATGAAPGLVDSPPTSMMSAPCAAISSARSTAADGSG